VRLSHALLPLPVFGAALFVACFDAPQNVDGGMPTFDAQSDPPHPSSDGGDAGDGEAGCDVPDAANATWTALYADLFGPASIGQCGAATRGDTNGSTSCHQDGNGNGAQASGFICGMTQGDCYAGITSPMATFIGEQVVQPGDPCTSYLPQVLRTDAGGIMPFYPVAATFSSDDIARVNAWIAAGAPNN
jgi:hypothetical protein